MWEMDAALRPTAQNNYWQCALWSLHALGAGAAACAAARCCSKMSLAACGLELGCWWCCRVLLHDVFGSVLCGARVLVVLPDVFWGALEPGHWCRCRVRLQDVYGSACFGASVLAAAGCFCRLVAQKHILLSGFIWGRNAGLLEQIQGNMISFEFVSFFPPMLNASLAFLDSLDPRGCAGQGSDRLRVIVLCSDGQPAFHYISP